MTCEAELKNDAQHTENINTNIYKVIAKNQHWPSIKLQSVIEFFFSLNILLKDKNKWIQYDTETGSKY